MSIRLIDDSHLQSLAHRRAVILLSLLSRYCFDFCSPELGSAVLLISFSYSFRTQAAKHSYQTSVIGRRTPVFQPPWTEKLWNTYSLSPQPHTTFLFLEAGSVNWLLRECPPKILFYSASCSRGLLPFRHNRKFSASRMMSSSNRVTCEITSQNCTVDWAQYLCSEFRY